MKAELAKEYKGLSRGQLLDEAFKLGFNYLKYSHSCSQCVVAAFHDMIGIDEAFVKIATSSCGGQAIQILGTCGALVGGTIVLDYFFGRPLSKMSSVEIVDTAPMFEAVETAKILHDKFIKEYGAAQCAQIQRRIYGRFFYPLDPSEGQKLEEAKAEFHSFNCWHVVGNATRWVTEILIDKNVLFDSN